MKNKMKILFVTIFHGHLSRNILRTDVINCFIKQDNLQIIVAVPDYKLEYYQNEFAQKQLKFVGISFGGTTWRDRFFREFYRYFVNSTTVKILQQEQFLLPGKQTRYFFSRLLTIIFGSLPILRKIIRYLDGKIVPANPELVQLLQNYQPDLVFASSITAEEDTMFLRCAQKLGITTLSMVRSWDTITVNKGNVRIQPDKILVQTELLKKDLQNYGEIPAKKIEVVGLSHFDFYVKQRRTPKVDFSKSIGANPDKKYIYFMPIGLSDGEQDLVMISLLVKIMRSHHQLSNYQLLVSRHPNSDKKLKSNFPELVMIEPRGIISFGNGRMIDREITQEAMTLMADTIYHSELIINYQGTSSIDAAAFNKPVINIAFDHQPLPYLKSVRRFYNFDHYLPIINSGAVRLANSEKDLEEKILSYINNPLQDSEKRQKMSREQGFLPDGTSGFLTARAILSQLNKE